MDDRWTRVFAGLLALAALWIAVYWWWPQRVRISFDTAPPPESPAVREPQPAAPARPVPAAPTPGPAPSPPPQPEFTEYVIRDGDTLSGIAQAFYGNAAMKDAIFRANRDRLTSPDRLRVGDRLRIPRNPTAPDGRP